MPTRIASMDLRVAHVPDDVEVVHDTVGEGEEVAVRGLRPVVDFAHTFNGYAHGGGPHQIQPVVQRVRGTWRDGGDLPRDLDRLRSCLFYWARGHVHGGTVTRDDAAWLNALLAAIRTVLGEREGPPGAR